MKGLHIYAKIISEDKQPHGRHLKAGPLQYEAREMSTDACGPIWIIKFPGYADRQGKMLIRISLSP